PPSTSTLFPYTTLFRSAESRSGSRADFGSQSRWERSQVSRGTQGIEAIHRRLSTHGSLSDAFCRDDGDFARVHFKKCFLGGRLRSEEHTSELQSCENLV